MSKSTDLIKNTAIIGIGSLGTKVLTFLLLPIYTAVLETEDYGIIDVLMTISSLIIPFATMEIGSAIFRFLIDKKNFLDQKRVVSSGLAVTVFGLVTSVIVTFLINNFYPIPHLLAFVLYYVSMSEMNIFSNLTRGLGNNVLYSFANFLVAFCSLLFNLFFIFLLEMRGVSILLATTIGNIIGIICLVVGQKLWKFISVKQIKKSLIIEMCRYSIPLISNTVSWWIVSASDRLIILVYLGAAANGIYAAANKIPGIYTTIFTVFSLAWSEAVARNTDDLKFVSDTFTISIKVMIYMLLGIVSCSSLFFHLLIGEKYFDCYFQVLILLIAIFFSSCASLLGGIFGAKFKSSIIMRTTLIGAVVNILINVIFIKKIGLYAASFSTLIAYFIVFVARFCKCRKWYDLTFFSKNDILLIPIAFLVFVGFIIKNKLINLVCIFCIVCLFIMQNRKRFLEIIRKDKCSE